MKMTFRYGWMLSLLLVLMFASTAAAQDMDAMCESVGLSPADCEIYMLATSTQVNSVQFDLDLAFAYEGSMFGDDPIHMAVVGSLAYDPDKLSALYEDTDALSVQSVQEAIAAVNTRLDVALDIPEWIRYDAPELPGRLRMGLALVDSVGYVELSDLHLLDPENIPSGWYGLDIRPFIPVIFGSQCCHGVFRHNVLTHLLKADTIRNCLKLHGARLSTHLDMLSIDPMILKSFKKLYLDSESVPKYRLITTNQMYLIILLLHCARKRV